MSSMSSLSSINSIASTDSGSINVDSVESDLFGDDGSGSLVLPSLLSASLHTGPPPPSVPSSVVAASLGPGSTSTAPPSPDPTLTFVNFIKCQQMHALITSTLTLPAHPPFHPQPDVQSLLLEGQRMALTEKQLMDRSLAVVPKRALSGSGGGGGGRGEGDGGKVRGVGVNDRLLGRSSSPMVGGVDVGVKSSSVLRGASPGRVSPLRFGLRVSASSSAIHSLQLRKTIQWNLGTSENELQKLGQILLFK